jgi:hypothetical protein
MAAHTDQHDDHHHAPDNGMPTTQPHDGISQGHEHHDNEHHQPEQKTADTEVGAKEAASPAAAGGHNMHAHMHGGGDIPMFANVTIAVCHCGAGCVLGDLIGEWIVYGTGLTINGRDIWPEWLIGKAHMLGRRGWATANS